MNKEYRYTLSNELEEEMKKFIAKNALNLSIEELVKIAVKDYLGQQDLE